MIAKTEASGGSGLLPQVLAFTSSLSLDRGLFREDVVGSLAHLTMLSRQRIVPREDAAALRAELLRLYDEHARGALTLPDEEDVHMAVEATLTQRLGERAGLLHTARSRNDQVALDLRLRAREVCAEVLAALAELLSALSRRGTEDREVILPSYTHRQRAQPISAGYLFAGYGAMFARDVEAFTFALSQADVLPLGVGAIAGTSLPIDRAITQALLRFSRLTRNGLDTVGDRDFVLDLAYAASKSLLHAARVATDFVDFSSQEFGYVKLDGQIACGSSMMPQKRNPDVFELVRGKSARGVGNLTSLLVLVKGLPGGYNRDLQEDRQTFLETGPLLLTTLSALGTGLAHARFDPERCAAAVAGDYTQATDLAEALAMKGLPFRTAYQAVGALVRRCQEAKLPLSGVTLELAQQLHPAFDAQVLQAADPCGSVGRKKNRGGTGFDEVEAQLAWVAEVSDQARRASAAVPRLDELLQGLREAPL